MFYSGETFDYFMEFFGKCFVRFFSNFGYDKMLKATGRFYCDFLQSCDNIHLQIRFTYPKMKSPSMQLTHTDENGAVLVYRSTRTGFSRYVINQSDLFLFFLLSTSNFMFLYSVLYFVGRYLMGQLKEIAMHFYKLENLTVKVLEHIKETPVDADATSMDTKTVLIRYRLDFDNREYVSLFFFLITNIFYVLFINQYWM